MGATNRSGEDFFRSLVDFLPDGIVIHAAGRIVFANPEAAKIFAAPSADRLLGLAVIDLVHPDDRAEVARRIRKVSGGSGVADIRKERLLRFDGQAVDVEVRAMPMVYEGEAAVLAIVRDVSLETRAETERERAQKALEDSERRFRGIFNNTPDAIAINDYATGIYLDVNPEFERLSGLRRNELLGRTPRETGLWADERVFKDVLRDIHRDGLVRNRPVEFRPRAGNALSTLFSALRMKVNDRTCVVSFTRDVSDRKKAERALLESEERYRELVERSTDGIFVHSQGRIVYANAALAKIAGAAASSELLGHDILEFILPEHIDSQRERIARVQDQRLPNRPVTQKIHRLNGELIDVEIVSIPIQYDGAPAVQVLVRDVTERIRAQDALIRHATELETWKRRHDAVIRASRQVLYSWDVATDRLSWDHNSNNLLGYEVLPTTLAEGIAIMHPDDRPVFAAAVEHSVQTGEPTHVTFRLRHADGGYRLMESSGYFVDDRPGARTEMVGFITDVTARRAVEDAARRYGERFQQLFSALPLGVFRSAPDGRFDDVNAALARLLGYADTEALRKVNIGILYTDDAQRSRLRGLLDEHGVVSGHELNLRRVDGSTVPAALSARVVRDADGRIIAYEGTVEDISPRKALEDDLRRARDAALEADRLKTSFLANMSHEIRTPLNVITGMTSLVADHLREIGDQSQGEFFDAIDKASKRLLTTIHGVLDISRFEAKGFHLEPARIDVAALIRDRVEEFAPAARARGIDLAAVIETTAIVRFDLYCLSQALANLLDNALKFTKRGRVAVRLSSAADGALQVEVSDTGVGIEAEFLPRLFNPFSQEDSGYTRRFEGSGLGLALVKNYLESNGATITAESEKGKGSTFRIRLARELLVSPRSPSETPDDAPDADETRRDRGFALTSNAPTLLVVEDDPETQLFMKALLQRRYDVLLAANDTECDAHLNEHGKEIRLVLMDVSLKRSADGLSIVRRLRATERWRDLPIIAVTGHAFDKDRENALAAGCDDYISKPIQAKDLFAKLSRLLESHEAA